MHIYNDCESADSNTATITATGSISGPAITGIKSKSCKPESSAIIWGSGFSTDKKKDLVYFGAKKTKKHQQSQNYEPQSDDPEDGKRDVRRGCGGQRHSE